MGIVLNFLYACFQFSTVWFREEEFAQHFSIATGLKSIKDEILKSLHVVDGNGIITVFLNSC